jgi:CMD domain protein
MSDGNPDVMDTLAGLSDGSPVAELRRQRPDVVRHLQGSDDVIFAPAHHGGFTRPEREAAAMRVATLLRDSALEEHYQRRLVALGETNPLTGARGETILAHVDCVTMTPDSATRADLDRLSAAGLTPHAIVSLSQLVAYVNFQSRVLAGLRMLRDAK